MMSMSRRLSHRDLERVFPGNSELACLMRKVDWSRTPFGAVSTWPDCLKIAVAICLTSRFPMVLWWGPDLLMLYNDAWRPVLGQTKHPAIAKPGREVWPEVWPIIGPMLEGVLTTGQAAWQDDQLLMLNRNGYPEETYFTYSHSPMHLADGTVGGAFSAVSETTGRVLGERRLRTLRDLGAQAPLAKTEDEACGSTMEALTENQTDVPFALLYLLSSDGARLTLSGSTPENVPPAWCPRNLDVSVAAEQDDWRLAETVRTGKPVVLEGLHGRVGSLPNGPWSVKTNTALALPLAAPGQERVAGVLVVGINPCRALDEEYDSFLQLLAGHIATTIANAHAYEVERGRTEALAELDRAKTAFFGYVSHEFCTPLTLLLGPLEELLAGGRSDLSSSVIGRLEVAHRNSLRLLKLIKTLLDFSRIEAGQVQPTYLATDLASFTSELAGVFRSAIEQAGLRLLVDCPPLPEPVYVDRDMWEKIVLNLLSNAFKFTFTGEIAVSLRPDGGQVQLNVRDTGIGIAPDELPKIFDRFHSVEGAQGRTHEGAGIGLALVQELATLHGGTVQVESTPGKGSGFRVIIPTGTSHVPPERIGAPAALLSAPVLAASPFVEEALQWLPAEDSSELGVISSELKGPSDPSDHSELRTHNSNLQHCRPRVLVAGDNADMRHYVARLLAERYDVQAVADGKAALAAAKANPPDLILSDVMMPRPDGFAFLREVRADSATRTIPVILLSARAGEESRVEGLQEGADDYLIKPFSTRELLARVASLLGLARMRKEAQSEIARSKLLFERIADTTPDLLWVHDIVEGRNVYINRRLEPVLGYGIQEFQSIPGGLTDRIVHPDDLAGIREWLTRFDGAADGEVFEHEHRLRHRDGSYRWIFARATIFEREPDGRAKQIIGVASDMTDRKQAEQALRQSDAKLAVELADTKILQSISAQLIQEENIEGLYERILDAAMGLMQSDMASMQIVDESQDALRMLAWRGFDPAFGRIFELNCADTKTTCSAARRAGRRVIVPDVETCDFITGTTALEDHRKTGIRAVQSTPLVSRAGKVVGMISTHWHQAHQPSERALRLLDVLARQAADLLERKRQEAELMRQSRQRQMLYELANAVNRAEALSDLYDKSLDAILISLNADRASILLLDEDGVMRFKAWRGISDGFRRRAEGHSPWNKDTLDPRPIAIGNIAETGIDRQLQMLTQQEGIQALGYIPLIYGGRLLGKFTVYFNRPYTMNDDDISLGQAIAGTLTLGIERKMAEASLRETKAALDFTLESAEVGDWDLDLIHDTSRRSLRHDQCFGYNEPVVEWGFERFIQHVHPEDRARIERDFHTAVTGLSDWHFECRVVWPDGSVHWIAMHGSIYRTEEGKAKRMLGIVANITKRKQAEKRLRRFNDELEMRVAERTDELTQSQASLRALATELNLTEQRERKRMATELHDYLAQLLVLGKMKLGQSKRLAEAMPGCAELINQTDKVLTEALTYTRTLVAELSPPVLHDFGLPAALSWLGERMRAHRLAVTVQIESADVTLPEDQAMLLFQSVRELLMNSAKYAKSGRASVGLVKLDGQLQISVRDDGPGFDLVTATATDATTALSSKFGLYSIRERMRALGGRFELQSSPDQGTTAILALPLGGGAAAGSELGMLRSEVGRPGPVVLSDQIRNSALKTLHSHPHQQDAKIRVLLVDDHAMVRQGLRSVLDSYADMEVVGEAWNGEEAVALVERLQPAIVLMDINMPKMNGVEATAEITSRYPAIVVIGLSVNAGGANELAMRNAGAATLLTKEAAVDELYRTIQETLGAKVMSKKGSR